MKSMIQTVIIINCIFLLEGTVIRDDKQKQAIQELEKERGELYVHIQKAIESSISSLSKANDSDALEGIKYMQELKEHLAEFNATDIASNETETFAVDDNKTLYDIFDTVFGTGPNETDARRRFRVKYEDDNDKLKDTIMEFTNKGLNDKTQAAQVNQLISGSKKKLSKIRQRIEMEKKVRSWLTQKERERKRIQMYQQKLRDVKRQTTSELCPDYGVRSKKIYPCCRKCCKSSYLGCLK